MKKYLTALIISAAAFAANAQVALKVTTGGTGGTYSRLFKELNNVCSTKMILSEVPSTGSMQNVDRLVGNEVNAAFVQNDVLAFRARSEDQLASVKTLIALHPEEVHVVARTVSGVKEGGTMGFGAKDITLASVSDLAGRTVVAAGGSFITAQVIRLQTEINFNVKEVATAEDALKAVADGSAHAAILVGGAPLGQVAALTPDFKLLSFDTALMGKLKNVYSPARVTYSKMRASGVQTVATSALFVTREYKSAKFVEGLANLRACFKDNLVELSETPGTHAKWQVIDAANKGKWPYLELPVAAANPAKK